MEPTPCLKMVRSSSPTLRQVTVLVLVKLPGYILVLVRSAPAVLRLHHDLLHLPDPPNTESAAHNWNIVFLLGYWAVLGSTEVRLDKITISTDVCPSHLQLSPPGLDSLSESRLLYQVKRFLSTLIKFGADISVAVGEKVKKIVFDLVVSWRILSNQVE